MSVGRWIIISAWVATIAFVLSVVLAVAVPAIELVAVVVSALLFFIGSVVALVAFGIGIVRSARGDDISVANLFLLQGSAPKPVRRQFLWVLVASLAAVALSFANLTVAPYAWLALMVPVGFPGLWAARHGKFPARPARPARRPTRR